MSKGVYGMTTPEILIIAAAVALFAVINVIMWSVIAKKNKKTQAAPSPTAAVQKAQISVEQPPVKFNIVENIIIVSTDQRIK